ncbi:MAG: serine phosphatase [Verrucomicrobia bacterium]|jgi:sigma-B regulation protein RsbU (phosphoserine phosphatase)|nr:serine phosphatase [Verrucomicrobiota bacterium]
MSEVAPSSGLKAVSTTPARLAGTGARLLVVDDDCMNSALLSERLHLEGYVVEVANDGQTALDKLGAETFELVLLDIVMPDMDGYDVLKKIKADPKLQDIPVIMISGLDDLNSVARCIEIGADDYLPKPYKPVLLQARINACLEKKQLREQEQKMYRALVESQKHLAAELNEAAEYVISLLPPPMTGEVTTEWCFIPSTQLGGDSFGYHWLDEENLAIYLLDVCGHGVGAALLSISAMNVLRAQSLANTDFRDPAQVLMGLNEAFQMDRQNNMYFTIWYGVFNKKKREISYARGGHPPAVLVTGETKETSERIELKSPGLVVGTMAGVIYRSKRQAVGKYAELFLFSDGVYELTNSEERMWDYQKFLETLTAEPPEGQKRLDHIVASAKAFRGSGNFEDDYSFLRIVL